MGKDLRVIVAAVALGAALSGGTGGPRTAVVEGAAALSPVAREQAALEPDRRVVQAYARGTGLRISTTFSPTVPVRLQAILSGGDLADVAEALTRRVSRPDLLTVRFSRAVGVDTSQLMREIGEFLPDAASRRIGTGVDGVAVVVDPSHEHLAAELHRRYGDSISIEVGMLPFPKPARAYDLCPAAPAPESPKKTWARLQLATAVVGRGDRLVGELRVRGGPGRARFETGTSALVLLVHPGTGRMVSGTGSGGSSLAAREWDLLPLEQSSIPASGGTYSCTTAAGYEVPPGEYTAIAVEDYAAPSFAHGNRSRRGTIVTPPVPITIER